MLGLFAPRCPLNTLEKTWTERRMSWLLGRVGLHRLLEAVVVLPTPEFFPEPYQPGPQGARALLDRVCGSMQIPPGRVRLEVSGDVWLAEGPRHYDSSGELILRIGFRHLNDPMRLVANLAHQLAHGILQGGALVRGDESDLEELTELLPLCLGMGIFPANATLIEETGRGHRHLTTQGFLPTRIHGYGLALFAFIREDWNPSWIVHLRPDAAAVVRDGLRFLRRTRDTLCQLERLRQRDDASSVGELLHQMESESATYRMASLHELLERGLRTPELIAAVSERLLDRDPYVAGLAARYLAASRGGGKAALPLLLRWTSHRVGWTRGGAARALGALGRGRRIVVPRLCEMLADPDPVVVHEAASALAVLGPRAGKRALRPLLQALRIALILCDYSRVDRLAHSLRFLGVDLKPAVQRFYRGGDRELRRRTWEAIRAAHPVPPIELNPFGILRPTQAVPGQAPPTIG